MDPELKQREADAVVNAWLEHPVTKATHQALAEAEEAFVSVIVDYPVVSLESFFAHFTAIGHLRGLRASRAMMAASVDDTKEELAKIET